MPEIPDVLPVLHPVPVRYMPRRGRVERMALAQVTTPVRLTRADPAAFESAMPGRLPDGGSVIHYRIGGRVHAKATTPGPDGRCPDLAVFLSGRETGTRNTQMAMAFAGTPVSAMLSANDAGGRDWPFADVDHRGDPHVFDDARELTFDGTEAARAAVQDFFDRNVRISGRSTVYVDTGGPLYAFSRTRLKDLYYRPSMFPRMRADPADEPSGALTREEAVEFERRRLLAMGIETVDGMPVGGERVHGVPRNAQVGRGVVSDTDTLFANQAPGRLLDMLAPAIRAGSRGPMGEPETRAGIDLLRWMALRGSIGGIPAQEAVEVVEHVREVAMWGMTMRQISDDDIQWLKGLREHCWDWVLPRLRGVTHALADEDVLAIGSLAP